MKEKEFATPKDPKKFQSSTKKQPTSSVKKTPISSNQKTPAKTTPRYLDVCDSDTPSDSSSSDEDFKPNETWNASSDEEYKDEAERIKKRSIARKSRQDEEIIFVPDESVEDKQKKLDDLLERYEYKKPPGMQGTDTPTKKPSKRKLFTHSHYDDELNLDNTPNDEEERKERNKGKENDENTINLPGIFFPRPLPVTKKDTAKKIEIPPPLPIVKRTPKSKVQTPKSTVKPLENKFAAYSFLKSLDVGVNPILCNADALYFRNNYKSKRTELTDKLFKLYDEKVFDGQLSVVPVKWNKKLLNTAGRCNNSRRGGVRQSQLELSEKVLTSADRLRCTLIHEMCHAATWVSSSW
jgi:SprT-like family